MVVLRGRPPAALLCPRRPAFRRPARTAPPGYPRRIEPLSAAADAVREQPSPLGGPAGSTTTPGPCPPGGCDRRGIGRRSVDAVGVGGRAGVLALGRRRRRGGHGLAHAAEVLPDDQLDGALGPLVPPL